MAKQQAAASASAKLVSGTKKTSDVLVQVAQEVETLSQKKAFELVDELIAEGGVSEFRLGGALAVISDKAKAEGGEEWLENHATFKELCDQRFNIHYRKAMYLIDIYKHLVEQQIPWSEVKDLGWTKLSILCRTKAINNKNADKMVAKAAKMTVLQLEDSLKGGDSSSKPATITFKVHEDQKEAIREALEKGKKEFKTDVDTVVLHSLCQGYLGNAITVEVDEAMDEKPKQKTKLKEYWTDRIRAQIKEMKADFEDSNESAEIALGVMGEEYDKITINVEFPA